MPFDSNSTLLRLCAIAAIGAATLAACSDEQKGPESTNDTIAAVQPSTPSPVTTVDTAAQNRQMDTSDGTLTVTASAADKGSWKFLDVTASLEEKAMAGSTSAIFMLEAHNGPEGRHFRIRLRNEGGEIAPGTFKLGSGGDSSPMLEGRWENNGKTYNSAQGGTGRMELKTFGDRAIGTFDMELVQADSATGATVKVKGSFDQKVVR